VGGGGRPNEWYLCNVTSFSTCLTSKPNSNQFLPTVQRTNQLLLIRRTADNSMPTQPPTDRPCYQP